MKLLILNGPWGVGKSTAAKALHARMSRAFHVELDAIRRCMSAYDDDSETNFRFAVHIAHDIIARCLADGRDVIVDKMLRAPELIDEIGEAGRRSGAEIYEIILWAPKDVVLARGEQRGYSVGIFSREKAVEAWDMMHAILPQRPNAHIIDTTGKSAEDVQDEIAKVIGLQ